MKGLWIAALTAGALTVSSACQNQSSVKSSKAPAETGAAALIGTDVVAELSKSVDAKKVKPGDLVTATVTQDVLSHGKIAIRRGSKLLGHVTQTKVRSKEDQESRLGAIFEKAMLKGGGEMDFAAAVRAIAPPVRLNTMDRADPMPPSGMSSAGSFGGPPPVGSGIPSGGRRGAGNGATSNNDAVGATGQAPQSGRLPPVSPGTESTSESGLLSGGSRGVFGLPGLRLTAEPGGGHGSIISSTSHNVKLESGTQMVIQINNVARD